MVVAIFIHLLSLSYFGVSNGLQKRNVINFHNGNEMKISSIEQMKYRFKTYSTPMNENKNIIKNIYNLFKISINSSENLKNDYNLKNNKQDIYDTEHLYEKSSNKKHQLFPSINRKRRDIQDNNGSNSNVTEMEILNRDLSPVNMNNFTLEYVNLDLNWHKFINVNKLGYRLVLINNGKEEAQWTFVGDSKPEYVLSRLKPNYTYTVRITPVSCKLQVDFNINTPRLISDKEAIALINMIQREEKNLTNIRNIGISFKNDLINHTGYILDVELLTRYNEGSKTVLVQIVNLIPDIKRFTISNLKPCSIYKLTVHKEERLILEVSKATSLFHSFYIFTGYTDDFKSNIPVAQSIQTTGMMYNSGEKYSHLKSIGITPRKTVTCYVENESPFSGFACRNSDICVPLSWVCDGEDDCVDGDDELNCRSHNFPDQLARNICRKNEFRCYTRGDYVCLPISWLCDGRQDCADGWDENRENCRTPFNRPGSTAYNANAVTCDRDYFRCFNGLGCVAPGFVCDGDQDCSDGSDEWGCKTNSRCNGRYEFQCFNDDLPYNPYSQYRNHRCIPKSWVCDDQDDCPNGEDESFETCNVVRRLGTASGLFSVIKKIVDPFTYY